MEMKLRTVEGRFGDIDAIVTGRSVPKQAQIVTIPIKPLSLHYRTHTFEEPPAVNTLRVTGAFTQGHMHEWVSACLPGVPPQ